ncbi:MAG: B-box zinc finger protein [Candidatus Thorarchaeota archaeon]
MRKCKQHPDREAVVLCSRCDSPMCEECIGSGEGPVLCPDCRGIQTAKTQETIWDQTSPTHYDMDKVNRYLLVGIFGGILSILGSILSLIVIISFFYSPYQLEFFIVGPITGGSSFLYTIEPILTGIGFLGFYHKFESTLCRIVLFVNIIGAISDFILSYLFPFGVFTGYYIMVFFEAGIYFVISIITAGALWQIRNQSSMMTLTTGLAIGYILPYPLTFFLGFSFVYFYPQLFIPEVLSILIAFGLMILFAKERSTTYRQSVHSSW